MIIQCTICSDLINPSENIFVTKCGHLFHYDCLHTWIERSKSCPQCRHRITNKCMFRVFPNTTDGASAGDETVPSLLVKLDNEKLQLRQKELEIKELRETNTKINSEIETHLNQVKALKSKILSADSALAAAKEQICFLKNDYKQVKKENEELRIQKEKAQTLQGLQKLLNSTAEEAEMMLQSYTEVRTVSIFAAALKKALDVAEEEKNQWRNKYQAAKQEGKMKIEALEQRISTLNKDYELVIKKYNAGDMCNTSHLDDSWHVNISKVISPERKVNDTTSSNTSLNTLVDKIENADSPYLNLKQSGLAWAALQQATTSKGANIKPSKSKDTKKLSKPDEERRPSIFLNSVSALPEFKTENSKAAAEMDISYDGLGGHSKFADAFPKPKLIMKSYTKTLTDKHRLKRPNPTGTADIGQLFKKLRDQ
ncbi:ring finger domain-containing protein [Phthorimaea operculella]|nr:ring finger domain-containing protein [Phthorimaea operculella]